LSDKFDIEAKLKITGVEVKGDLDAGTLKFKVDTSALKKLVSDAGEAAKKVKAKFDKLKLNKIKLEVNKTSLRTMESQIRNAVQNAVKKTKLELQANVAGGTKTDPFKAQRQAAGKSAQSLQTLHELTKQVNQGLRSLVRTMGSMSQGPASSAAKGNLPFPPGARTVSAGSLGGGGGGTPRPPGGSSPGGAGRGGGGVGDLSRGMQNLAKNTQNANEKLETLEDLTFQVGRKAAAFRGVAIAINGIVTAAQNAAKFIIDFNDSLIEVNKILQLSDASLNILGDDLFSLSAKTGVASDQTIGIAEAFARAGLAGRGYGSVVDLTDRALVGLQGTTLDAGQATELFIQIIQQVEGGVRGLNKELVTTTKLFDVLGKAEDITASKATDVQQAFKRSAASIFATGATIEQATAIISVLQERTQRGGDVIGAALKTLASRISSSTSDATKALNEIGVETIDAQGNLRNLFDVLQDTAVAFNSLTESERADVAVKAAGIRQVEVFRAALLDFGRTQEVTNELVNASGDAARKQGAEQKKLANTISRLQLGLQQLVKTASEGIIGEAFVGAIDLAEKLVTGIAKLDKMLGGAVSSFGGLLAIGVGFKVIVPMLVGITRAVGFFIGMQKESAVAMQGINSAGMQTASTINGQLNSSMQRTATLTAQANGQMQQLSASTLFAASQAERLAKANAASALASPAGQAGIANLARGNIGNGGVDIIQTGGKGKGSAKGINKLGKAAQGTGLKVIGLGAVASIAGGALQSFADDLKKETGGGFLSNAADIGGGALGGAGTGALIGSIIPGIGTAIGASVGAIVGAFKPLVSAFHSAGSTIDELRSRYLQLGIIQAENGEVTSAVAAKLDKALRNLEGFQNFELGLEEGRLKDLFDPEGASKREQEVDKARVSAQKGLEAGFDRNASATERNAKVFAAISKALQARSGQSSIDLAAPELLDKSAPVLQSIGENTLREIETEALKIAETFGVSSEAISSVFDEEIGKIRNKPVTRETVAAAEREVADKTKAFVDSLDVLLPAGQQITRAAKEQAGKFKDAVKSIALGRGGEEAEKIVRETLAKALTGQTILSGAGGESLLGSAGRNELQTQVDVAQGLAAQRRNAGVPGFGSALPDILKKLGPLLDQGVEAETIRRQQERLELGRNRVSSAFDSTRSEFPVESFGRFLDTPINELGVILRDFISDFGREIEKMGEVQLRAITPQQQLADALAKNAASSAQDLRRRADLEKADALASSKQKFQTIAGRGERQFAGIAGEENNLTTVGDALQSLFQALLDANRKISDQGITNPDEQRRVLASAREGVDLTNIDDKQIKAVTDNVLQLSKTFVKLDTEALQAIVKSNAAAVAALKNRLSEEARLIALSERQRQATALNARAVAEELTGIRRLVAERQIEADLAEGSVTAQKGRLSSIDEEIAKLNAVEQTERNRAGVLDQLEVLERARADESIKLEEMLAKQRITSIRNTLQVANEAVNAAKATADQERKRISTLAEIGGLLAVDQTQMGKFNAELDSLSSQFKTSQAALASEAAAVNATITDQAEREERLADIKRRGSALALDQAKAEAQVIQKRREAVKQVAEEILGNQQEQVDAQRAVMEATRGVAAAFEGYLQAVDGAVMATTRYNLGLSLASVETTKITGGFSGMREEIGAVQDAFRGAESLARQLGASEKTLVEIRRDSINQQLSLFQNLLQEQSQLARNFFTSSAQDQSDLFLGINEAGSIADLLGGSFDNFKKLGEGAINDLGAQLLALPQETRQRVISSLESLKAVGGEVGGFTADELLTAIETASLGVSGEGLQVDPLFEVQERIASLQEEQARLATEQLLASQEQLISSKEQLEQAEAAKDLAEIQLERIKEEGSMLRGKMGELQGQLNTTLLQQEQTQRQGFNAVTSAVDRATNAIVNQLPNAFSVKVAESFREVMSAGGISAAAEFEPSAANATPKSRGREVAEAQRAAGRNRAVAHQQFAQSGASTVNQAVAVNSAPAGGGAGDINEANTQAVRRLEEVITELRTLNSTGEANLAVSEQILDSSGGTLGTASATVAGDSQPEITINVEGQTTVTVTGFEAGVARLATSLAESLGGFVSAEEARRIADEVLENIRTELLRRGIITPTTL